MDTAESSKTDLRILEQKIDMLAEDVRKTRRYFFWFLVLSLVALFLPLFGTLLMLPKLLNSLTSLGL